MPYFAFTALAVLLPLIRRPNSAVYYFLLLIFVFFAFITREGSWDYFGYKEYFLCSISMEDECGGFEKSFSVISILVNEVVSDFAYEVTYMFYVVLSLFIKFKLFRKHSTWFGVSLFSYACYGFFLGEMTQIRASLAIAIAWYALSKYSSGKNFLYCAMLGLASLFHISALLFIVVPILKRIKTSVLVWCVFISIVFGYIIFSINFSTLPKFNIERIDVYLSAMGSKTLVASRFNLYVVLLAAAVFILLRQKEFKSDIFNSLCIKLALFGICIYFAFYKVPVIPLRVLEFYSSLYPFIFALALSQIKGGFNRAVIFLIPVVLFFNLAVRNNARLDMVFDWQNINYDYMTEIQREQYRSFND